MTIVTLPSKIITGSCPDFVISDITESLQFVLSLPGVTILQETYSPDSANTVTIRDLQTIFEHNMPDGYCYAQFAWQLTSGNNTKNGSIDVFFCKADVAGSVSSTDFMLRPLTKLLQRKTSYGRREIASFMHSNEAIQVCFVGRYFKTDGTVAYFDVKKDMAADAFGKLFSIECSPEDLDLFLKIPTGSLIAYSIYLLRAGVNQAPITFEVDSRKWRNINSFEFTNLFNAPDRVTCTGVVDRNITWARSTGVFASKFKNYNSICDDQKTINTGWLTRGEFYLFLDLLNSQNIKLLGDYDTEITIIEDNIDVPGESQEPDSFEFKYRATTDNQYRHKFESAAPYDPSIGPEYQRIFDKTFDNTFN